MSQLRLEVTIDAARADDDHATQRTVAEISARLLPGMEASVGAIDYRHGERAGVEWSAEGWSGDETFVQLSAEVGATTVTLWIDTCPVLRPPRELSRTYTAGLVLSTLGLAGAAGWWFREVWPVVGAVVGTPVAWMVVDIMFDVRKDRAARRRVIDEADWRRRLEAAIVTE